MLQQPGWTHPNSALVTVATVILDIPKRWWQWLWSHDQSEVCVLGCALCTTLLMAGSVFLHSALHPIHPVGPQPRTGSRVPDKEPFLRAFLFLQLWSTISLAMEFSLARHSLSPCLSRGLGTGVLGY